MTNLVYADKKTAESIALHVVERKPEIQVLAKQILERAENGFFDLEISSNQPETLWNDLRKLGYYLESIELPNNEYKIRINW